MATQTANEGAIVKDDELKAINDIVKRLMNLKEPARQRVWAYVNARFAFASAILHGPVDGKE